MSGLTDEELLLLLAIGNRKANNIMEAVMDEHKPTSKATEATRVKFIKKKYDKRGFLRKLPYEPSITKSLDSLLALPAGELAFKNFLSPPDQPCLGIAL